MGALGRLVQVGTAGLGFFLGYAWVVVRWAGSGDELSRQLLQTALEAGGVVTALYMLLLAGLFWACLPLPDGRRLRMVLSPAAFTLSWGFGVLGMQGALWALGGG